jgi:hypothetical protein
MKAIQLNRAPAIRESRAKVVQISYNRAKPNKEKSLLESNSLIATRLSGPKNTPQYPRGIRRGLLINRVLPLFPVIKGN